MSVPQPRYERDDELTARRARRRARFESGILYIGALDADTTDPDQWTPLGRLEAHQ